MHALFDEFKQDRRHIIGRRLSDRKLNICFTVLAQPPENLAYLIASNDAVYIRPVFLPFLVYFYTKYNANISSFRLFLSNLYQIQKRIKITRKHICTAVLGVFLFVPNQYQITHSPTPA